MKAAALVAGVVLAAVLLAMTPPSVRGSSCDGYGNCLNSFVSYIRSNPDSTLYPGDQFVVYLQLHSAQNTSSNTIAWNYDTTALESELGITSAFFTLKENVTTSKYFSITASVTLIVNVCSNGKCISTPSVLQTTQDVLTAPLVLQLRLEEFNSTWRGHTLRNPDGTFYPYDRFGERWNASFKFSDVRKDISINVTSSEPSILSKRLLSNVTDRLGRHGEFLYSVANKSNYQNPYQVSLSAKAFNWENESLSHRIGRQELSVKSFVLQPSIRIVNVTDSYGNIERNPDGSFYRNDTFCLFFNVTFSYQKFRTDITTNVTSVTNPTLALDNSSAVASSSAGKFCYTAKLGTDYQSYNTAISFRARSWNNNSMGLRVSSQPFTVVRYAPHFTYFTYMLYNSKNSSAYERPFVTLVRYDGNSPGYSYGGDDNTGAFTADNSTGERAWINSFTFSTDGWKVRFVSVSPDIRDNLYFEQYAKINVTVTSLNATALTKLHKHLPVTTWHNRVQKYYFGASVVDLSRYAGTDVIFFDVRGNVSSKNFAGGSYPLFSTSYLYEPIYYNGYLVFEAFDRNGNRDSQANITLTAFSPSPLNPYLISKVQRAFGNDSRILHAFKLDFYQAYNTTQTLKPMMGRQGTWVYLLNQTNLADINNSGLPSFTVQVTGRGSTISYAFDDSFSLFQLGNETLPSMPFRNSTIYYLDQGRQLLAQPLNFSLSSRMPFVEWSYNSSMPSFFSPVSYEPGNLTKLYPFPYGRNTTIYVNLDGGGAYLLSRGQVGTNYVTTVYISPQSGGATEVWARDSEGTLLGSEPLPSNSLIPQPEGFIGEYVFTFPLHTNGTVSIGTTNSWGVSNIIASEQVTVHTLPPPPFPEVLVWWFVAIVIMFYFIGRAVNHSSS